MLEFDFYLDEIEFFEIEKDVNQEIINELTILNNLSYRMSCKSNKNTYALDSYLDESIESIIEADGNTQIYPEFQDCYKNIDYDFAMQMGNKKVVFEIEKSNKEKILYDYLKAHIYMKYEIDNVVIIVPKNWIHSKGKINLFEIAKENIKLCYEYQMGNKKILEKIIIVGFTQMYKDEPLTIKGRKEIKKECKDYFQNKNR